TLSERAVVRDPHQGHVASEVTSPFGDEGEPLTALLLREVPLEQYARLIPPDGTECRAERFWIGFVHRANHSLLEHVRHCRPRSGASARHLSTLGDGQRSRGSADRGGCRDLNAWTSSILAAPVRSARPTLRQRPSGACQLIQSGRIGSAVSGSNKLSAGPST